MIALTTERREPGSGVACTAVERFVEYDAEQWFGVWSSATPSG
ncbi:hypothetical protein [Planomonospora parontospora]|nr:hypothetical protein [Planomonospora parontospora]